MSDHSETQQASVYQQSLELHAKSQGKMGLESLVPLETVEDLALAYTPGVAEPCRQIAKDRENAYKYTMKGHTVAVITDGSAVLGLGNIGPEAALPVMEGKCLLFKKFAGIDAIPICLDTQDSEEIIKTIKYLAPGLGGINLEDIAAPRCFEIEQRLIDELNIPIFHDDQHGTAIVVLAGLINALKITNRSFASSKIVMSGAGAAGVAIAKLLHSQGAHNIVICDSKGIISPDRENLNQSKKDLLTFTNPDAKSGELADALKGADIFIGISAAGVVSESMVTSMNNDAIIFAMANPVPEIMPDLAKQAGAKVIATGRSDFPNQINNVLAFPGIFQGVLAARAPKITQAMKVAAAQALAEMIENPTPDKIIPGAFDEGVAAAVAAAVKGLC